MQVFIKTTILFALLGLDHAESAKNLRAQVGSIGSTKENVVLDVVVRTIYVSLCFYSSFATSN